VLLQQGQAFRLKVGTDSKRDSSCFGSCSRLSPLMPSWVQASPFWACALCPSACCLAVDVSGNYQPERWESSVRRIASYTASQ
jgi:hypothetical protein